MSYKYNLLFSSNCFNFQLIKDKLKTLFSVDDKVIVFPWAFPVEMSEEEFSKVYFPKYGERHERDIRYLRELGIKDENVFIANCYKHSEIQLKEEIASSNIIVLPGGNPIMLTTKIIEYRLQDTLINYSNIIIGGSAGACIQFNKYFITEENNGPRGFQELEGLGLIDVDFMIDVHTNKHTTGNNSMNRDKYINKLRQLSKYYHKDIYAISDDGAILVDRKSSKFKIFGSVEKINNIYYDLEKVNN